MKRDRRQLRIPEAALSRAGADLPDKTVDRMTARLVDVATKLGTGDGFSDPEELFRKTAAVLLTRVLTTGYDISALCADPDAAGGFKKLHKGGRKAAFTEAVIAEAIRRVVSRPAGQLMKQAVAPLAKGTTAMRLLAAVDTKRFPRRR